MKSSTALNIAAAAVVFGLLSACGQTGPLYLPKPSAKPVQPATPANATPAQTPVLTPAE